LVSVANQIFKLDISTSIKLTEIIPIPMKKVLIIVMVLLSSSIIYATEENAIKEVVYKWNDLHNTRNTIEFKELYAPNVLF
jgi:hypothetical protein